MEATAGTSNGEGRRKSKVIPKLAESDYHLRCEWGECDVVSDSMSNIFQHVSLHMHEYVVSCMKTQLSSALCFTCGWKDCGAQILGSVIDFNRHVYFHVFHVRLKCLGDHQARFLRLGTCMLGSQSCNWIPELPDNLECTWLNCKIIFDNPYIFYSHVNHHAEEYPEGPNVNCKCLWKECKTTVRGKSKLREHLRSHTQEKLVACATCGGLFSSHTKLTDHVLRQANSDAQRYECSHCNRRFSTERMLREHMRRHVNNYKCPLCEMTCPSPSALRLHMRYKHSNEKPYKCGHCQFSTKSSADLRKHLDCHNMEDQFSCHVTQCNFSARSYNSLALHFKKHHQQKTGGADEALEITSPRYMCHVCHKTFARGYPLTVHLKKKHFLQWPPGHSRFRYKLDKDGYLRLQTVRYEGAHVSKQQSQSSSSAEILALANSTNSSARVRCKKGVVATRMMTAVAPPANEIGGEGEEEEGEEEEEEEMEMVIMERDEEDEEEEEDREEQWPTTTITTTDQSCQGGQPEIDYTGRSDFDEQQQTDKLPQIYPSRTVVPSEQGNSQVILQSASTNERPPPPLKKARSRTSSNRGDGNENGDAAESSVIDKERGQMGQLEGYPSMPVIALPQREYSNSAEANLHMLGDVALTSLLVPVGERSSLAQYATPEPQQ